jgi:hypothetical protein
MNLEFFSARILVVSSSDADSELISTFMERLGFNMERCKFVAGRIAPTDGYDFAIFNAMVLPRILNKDTVLSEEDTAYLQLFRDYLKKPIKYILYYGEFLYDLDKDRCPSANSKFTLFARIRELIDFINHYKD